MITRAPAALASCSAQIDTPPVPSSSTVLPARIAPVSNSACQAVVPAQVSVAACENR